MFDLKVEVTHPPVDELERTRLDVHRVDGGIADPISLFQKVTYILVMIHRGEKGNISTLT